MGIVEDLFTLPAYRRRGIATALIRHAVAYARDRGMTTMLIGALAEETAKSLYVSLGFVPQCLTRHYLLDAPSWIGGRPLAVLRSSRRGRAARRRRARAGRRG
jgi:ribosomal protein S18 acetylase RimI-like enzyme